MKRKAIKFLIPAISICTFFIIIKLINSGLDNWINTVLEEFPQIEIHEKINKKVKAIHERTRNNVRENGSIVYVEFEDGTKKSLRAIGLSNSDKLIKELLFPGNFILKDSNSNTLFLIKREPIDTLKFKLLPSFQ
jgi:heterodisulfide reductase subunit C